MKTLRAITAGALVWAMVFALFTVMSFIPVIKDSELQQNMMVYIFLIPFAAIGSVMYYKKGLKTTNGIIIGIIMAITGLVLDAAITVPFVIEPAGGSYVSFFLSPLLAITVVEFITVVYFHWKIKILPSTEEKAIA